MARKIFGVEIGTEADETEARSTHPARRSRSSAGSVAGLRDSLRDLSSNSIRDIDPSAIDGGGLTDRLGEDDRIEDLAESIRTHGQQVPILVRPTGQPDRYTIVYGRRRLAALKRLARPVKAIVRTLSDEEAILAQGQENNLRLDPSFIEKAIFIREMKAAGYSAGVIRDALGLSRQSVSAHITVIADIPDEVIERIGAAHGVGRRQWAALAEIGKSDGVDLVDSSFGVPHELSSDQRFEWVMRSARRAAAVPRIADGTEPQKYATASLTLSDGRPIGEVRRTPKAVEMRLSTAVDAEFSEWLEANAETIARELHDRWRREGGSEA